MEKSTIASSSLTLKHLERITIENGFENKDIWHKTILLLFADQLIISNDALENVSGKKVYIVFIKMFVLVKINLLKTSICSRFTKATALKEATI
jgi:hypothetical protein